VSVSSFIDDTFLRTGTAYPSRALDVILVFSGIRIARFYSVWYIVDHSWSSYCFSFCHWMVCPSNDGC